MTEQERTQREEERRQAEAYWKKNIRLIAILLAIWATVSFLFGIILAEPLNQALRLGNLPLGFWFAQQGSIYVFVILIFVYAWQMNRFDREYGYSE